MESRNGKITSIEVQKRNKDRVNVFVNYEFAFACNMELVYKEGLSKGCIIDERRLKEIVYKAVSYTHLDVYKRQLMYCPTISLACPGYFVISITY